MRKIIMTIAAAVALLAAGSLANRAEAGLLGNPGGIRASIDDIAVTEDVHCRPGWRHHRWRRGHPTWDGCRHYRSGFAPFIVVSPRVFHGPRFRSHRFSGHRFGNRRGRR
jgi:hypothetical protein